MAGAGKRTFTAGEVLTAASVNDYLMDQTVMNFAGTAARASAIPTPSEGMVSYRADTDNLELYNGSAWVATSGMVKIAAGSFTAATTVIVANSFSAAFRRYMLVWEWTASAASISYLILRNGTTPDTTANYANTYIQATGSTLSAVSSNESAALFANQNTSQSALAITYITNPFAAENTLFDLSYQTGGGATSPFFQKRMVRKGTTTSYNNFQVDCSTGNMTGTYVLYGLQD